MDSFSLLLLPLPLEMSSSLLFFLALLLGILFVPFPITLNGNTAFFFSAIARSVTIRDTRGPGTKPETALTLSVTVSSSVSAPPVRALFRRSSSSISSFLCRSCSFCFFCSIFSCLCFANSIRRSSCRFSSLSMARRRRSDFSFFLISS